MLAMYSAARTIPLTPALLILGALAGDVQLLDAGSKDVWA
jgi:hypothetical protein